MRRLSVAEWIAVAVALLIAAFIFSPRLLPFVGWPADQSATINNALQSGNAEGVATTTEGSVNTNQTMQNISTTEGIEIYEIQKGPATGELAESGKRVTVHYVGAFTDGTVFDSSVSRGTPFTFSLGAGEVIRGWDVGVEGMRIGDVRRFVIAPALAYGAQGQGPIPPNSTLIFEVQLLDVQ